MKLSKANSFELSDVLNVVGHLGMGLVGSMISGLLMGLETNQTIDWKTVGVGVMVTLLHNIQVVVKRYIKDNNKHGN